MDMQARIALALTGALALVACLPAANAEERSHDCTRERCEMDTDRGCAPLVAVGCTYDYDSSCYFYGSTMTCQHHSQDCWVSIAQNCWVPR